MQNKIRKGLKSIWWKPELVEGAIFDELDIPLCITTAKELPKDIIPWDEAKIIYKKQLKKNFKEDFIIDAFVCFYIDDYKFDTFRGVWFSFKSALKILKHFKGVITADFSTYYDFPYPLKLWNTYRMRAFGFACNKQRIEVINNVRGRSQKDYNYCFNGIETNSIICIGTVGSGLKYLENREMFESWLNELVNRLKPHTIITYGSANYNCFKKIENRGVKVISYESKTSKAYKRRNKNEQK